MAITDVPFNISLLNLTDKSLFGIKPVTSLDIFDGMSKNFHESGLYSVSIFGRSGDVRRKRRFSYIDLKVSIFHPVVYRALVNLKGLYEDIMGGKVYAEWDNEKKDFIKSTPLKGETGFYFFVKHWQDIVFEDRPSDLREENIKLLAKYKNKCMIDKLVVYPAGLRDIQIEKDGRVSKSEIHDYYHRILAIANTIPRDSFGFNLEMLNNARLGIQKSYNELFALFESMINGKKKLIMDKWASRRIFNGTRNVISTMPLKSKELNSLGNIGCNDTVVGLYQYIKAILPITKFQLKNGFLSKVFLSPSSPAILIDKKTLKSVSMRVNPKYFDAWMTDEGLEKTITLYSEESLRNMILEIENHYVGLIYKGPGVFKLFQDIDELPNNLDKKDVFPLTFTELLYISVYADSKKYPAFVTRYPVTGFGSIYPSKVLLKVTSTTEERKPLNDYWMTDAGLPIAYNFPTNSPFFNSFSPHPNKLAGLGADFDGDTSSLNIAYTDESVKEVEQLLNSKRFYVGGDGRINFSCATDTIKYLIYNLTRKPK